jgi:glutamate/tyrosine decarboxylase-like PLP-dependent enzyme
MSRIWALEGVGVKAFAEMIEQNVQQARYLADLITEHSDLENYLNLRGHFQFNFKHGQHGNPA